MAEFFKYIWHCIWGVLGYLSGSGQDNYSWKDFGVAMLIFLLIFAIFMITRLILINSPSKNDSSNEEQI